jgi:microcystin-dependent protein
MSNIDPSKPDEGQATTQSVRDNFQAAADETDANAQGVADNAQGVADNAAAILALQQQPGGVAVEDEGIEVEPLAYTLDFVGDGITATPDGGNKVTVTVPKQPGTTISDTPPPNPVVGQGWWGSEVGRKFIWYDDGDSQQWVEEDPSLAASTNSVVGVGMVASFPYIVTDPNWQLCDGSELSRTGYSTLFAAIGITYGNGDGSTTFNVPDYRGVFLRGQDMGAGVDPDAATRTGRGDGVTGDYVGTKQADEFKTHWHGQRGTTNTTPQGFETPIVNAQGGTAQGTNTASENTGGNETRPVNTYVRWYIYTGATLTVEQSTGPAILYGFVDGATGAVSASNGGLSGVRNSQGNYTLTFDTPMPDTNYNIQMTGNDASSRICFATGFTASEFTARITDNDGNSADSNWWYSVTR